MGDISIGNFYGENRWTIMVSWFSWAQLMVMKGPFRQANASLVLVKRSVSDLSRAHRKRQARAQGRVFLKLGIPQNDGFHHGWAKKRHDYNILQWSIIYYIIYYIYIYYILWFWGPQFRNLFIHIDFPKRVWRSCSIEVKNSLDLRVQPSGGMHRRLSPSNLSNLSCNCPGTAEDFQDFQLFSMIFHDFPGFLMMFLVFWFRSQGVPPFGWRCRDCSFPRLPRVAVLRSALLKTSAEDYRDTTRLRTPLMWATDLVGLDSDPEQWTTIAEQGFERKRR